MFEESKTRLLRSSADADLFVVKHKSTMETFVVGTLIANPSSFQLSSGITNPTAAAAPVLVGIIDWVADLALLKSV